MVDAPRSRAIHGALTFIVLFVSAIAATTSARAADPCPTACDLSCASCCSHWQIRATCSGGATKEEGDFRTFDEARTAAAGRDKCAAGDAECEKKRLVCPGNTPATAWEVHCAAEHRLSRSELTTIEAALVESAALLGGARQQLEDAQKNLHTFATKRAIRDKGLDRVAAAADALRAASRRIALLDARRKHLAAQPSTAGANALGEEVRIATREATSAVELAGAVMNDPAVIDRAAEEREQRALAAARAREDEKARAEALRMAAEEKRQRAREEEEARRREAEAQRLAARQAAEQKEREQRSQQEALASASAAEQRRAAEQKRAATTQTLGEADALLGGLLAGVAERLAIANLSPQERARAQSERQRLLALQTRARELRGRTTEASQRSSGDTLAQLSRVELGAATLVAEIRAISGARAATASSASEATPVPSCLVSFAPAPGQNGATLSLDGGKPVPLPAKLRISSGRHALTVGHGGRTHRRSELLVCGRIDALTIGLPK